MLDFGYYNMDCMQGMKEFPDGYFDLAIVDPPYGINVGSAPGGATLNGYRSEENEILRSNRRSNSVRKQIIVGGGLCKPPKIYKAFDDSHTPDAAYFKELERVAKKRIIWGGNYFLDYLPATECFIVWDKRRRGLNFADCELAWTDIKLPCRIFEFKWNGMLQEDMKNKEERIHPTQKPVALYKWILDNYAKPGDKILDTHVGSASSLIACEDFGFQYVGFEIDADYYRLGQERLERNRAQMTIADLITDWRLP